MLCGMEIKISDVDIFGKRLGLFYKNKEKISSYFGLIITCLYIFISLGIFIYYTILTIKHIDMTVSDSTIYSKNIPNINLNNSDLLYFAFAIEEPITAFRFIDETIYTVKAIFYDSVKNENGEFKMKEIRDLKIERCNKKKFGDNYQHLFTEKELNNSYCISEFDFVLEGGFIYDKLSLIRLDVFPCKNSTKNNFHCKPQKIIDRYLAGGYFSILLKDIGLNPSNYSLPILPTLQDLYTTISKQFFKDLILYYEITEIKTDSGIFLENLSTETYLKFDKRVESIFLRPEEMYYNGESILGVQIRLSYNIHVQNREYRKMHNVFATAGGYMQMLNTLFSLISIFPNKFFYDNIIINNLFDFDAKKNKINFKNKKYNIKKKKYMSDLDNFIKEQENNKKSMTLKLNNKNENVNSECKSECRSRNSKNYIKSDKSINVSAYEKINNVSKNYILPYSNNLNLANQNNLIYIGKNKLKIMKSTIDKNEEYYHMNFSLNIFDYLCLGNCNHRKKQYEQFRKGSSIFKKKLDIINIFNCILFYEKKSDEEINNVKIW